MIKGIVRFVGERGSGFIRCMDDTDIFFFRPSPANRPGGLSLRPGQVVEFEVVRSTRGRHAVRVALVK